MTTHRFSDREKIRLSIKLNPLWWLGNDTEQTVDQAEWYHQDWPEWRRSLVWELRNPLQNFRAFVIGVQDRNYEVEVVHGNPDPQVVQRNDVGEYGYQVRLTIPVSGSVTDTATSVGILPYGHPDRALQCRHPVFARWAAPGISAPRSGGHGYDQIS